MGPRSSTMTPATRRPPSRKRTRSPTLSRCGRAGVPFRRVVISDLLPRRRPGDGRNVTRHDTIEGQCQGVAGAAPPFDHGQSERRRFELLWVEVLVGNRVSPLAQLLELGLAVLVPR